MGKRAAIEQQLPWTEQQRALLHGARAAHPLDPPVPDRQSAWQKVLDLHARCRRTCTAEAPFAPIVEAVCRSFEKEQSPTKLDAQEELCRAWILGQENSGRPETNAALVPFWTQIEGVPFVLELFETSAPFAMTGTYSGNTTTAHLFSPANKGDAPVTIGGDILERNFWDELRKVVFALDDDAWALARTAASQARERLLTRHAHDAYDFKALHSLIGLEAAFAREPLWASERVRQLLELPNHPAGSCSNLCTLIASIDDPVLALRFAESWGEKFASPGVILYDVAYDIVETLGAAALPVLETLLPHAEGREMKQQFKAAIKLVTPKKTRQMTRPAA